LRIEIAPQESFKRGDFLCRALPVTVCVGR
jgi:hypothetical protein